MLRSLLQWCMDMLQSLFIFAVATFALCFRLRDSNDVVQYGFLPVFEMLRVVEKVVATLVVQMAMAAYHSAGSDQDEGGLISMLIQWVSLFPILFSLPTMYKLLNWN